MTTKELAEIAENVTNIYSEVMLISPEEKMFSFVDLCKITNIIAIEIKSVLEKPRETANANLQLIDIINWLNEKGYRRGMDIYIGEIAGLIKSFIDEYETNKTK